MRTTLILCLFSIAQSLCAASPSIRVEAGALDRTETIVSTAVDFSKVFPGRKASETQILLADGEREISGQWFASTDSTASVGSAEPGELLFVLQKPLPAGETRTYTLRAAPLVDATVPYAVERVPGEHVTLSYTGVAPGVAPRAQEILRYNDGIQIYEPDPDSHLSRSGYVHPLWSPSGHVVTGDRCPDHPHQRGCFFAWTKCTFRGEEVNFWEMKTGQSKTVSPPEVSRGPVAAELVAHNELLARSVPAIRETLSYRVIGGLASGWVIDFSVEHLAIGDPLWVELYHYGGMGFRATADWLDKELAIASSEGLPGREANYTSARWCAMTGPVDADGKAYAGVAYFDDPRNPRYPTRLRIHPSKPYFCFTHQQREGVCIDTNHPLRLRYRILVQDGRPDLKRLEAMANDLATPPKVTVILP